METECRIAILEKLMDAFDRRLKKVETHFSGDYQLVATKLTPHECPLCGGKGVVMGEDEFKLCKACDGKGIVWG